MAAWICGGAVAALVLAVSALHTPPARQWVLRQAVEFARAQGIAVAATSLHYNLPALSVAVEGLEVRSPQAPDLPPLFRADRVEVDLALVALLRGTYHVESAAIRNPRVHVAVDAGGRDNLPKLPESEGSAAPVDYLISALVISGGSLRFDDQRQRIAAELPLSRITVSGTAARDHAIMLESASGGRIDLHARTLPLGIVRTDFRLLREVLEVKRLEAALGDSKLALSGTVQDFAAPGLDLAAEADLELASLAAFAGVGQRVKGRLHMSVAATGPLPELRARARIASRDLAVEQFDRLALEAEVAYDAAAARVRLDSLDLSAPAGKIAARADVALTAGESSATLTARGVDLEQLSRTLQLPVRIASRAGVQASARWPALDFNSARAEAGIRLEATREAPAEDAAPLAGSMTASLRDGRVAVAIPELSGMGARAAGAVALSRTQALSGELRVEAPDVAATIAAAEALLGKAPGSLVGQPVEGAIGVTAGLSGTAAKPVVAATLSAPALRAGTLDGIALDSTVRYEPGRLIIEEAAVRWRNQSVIAAGAVGQELDIAVRTENLSIEDVLAGLGHGDIPVSGEVDLTARVTGSAAQPEAGVRLAATDVNSYGEVVGALSAEAQLRAGVLRLNQFNLAKPQPQGDGALRASGSYKLDGGDYTVSIESDNLRLLSLALPDGSPVRGEIGVTAQGAGNVENPAGAMRLAASGVRIGERLLGEIELDARVAERQATAALRAPLFGLSAEVRTGTQAPYPAAFEVHAAEADLSHLPPLAGTLNAVIRGAGDLDDYAAGRAEAEISSLDVEWQGRPIRTEGAVRARYEGGTLTLEPATVAAGGSHMRFSGNWPLLPAARDGAIRLAGELDLASLAQYIPSEEPMTAGGAATIEGAIAGNLRRVDPDLTLTLRNGEFSTPALPAPVSNVTLRAGLRGGALDVHEARANWGAASVAASGVVPLALAGDLPIELPRREGPARLTAELERLDLAALPGAPQNLAGAVSARLEATAARPELEAVTASLTFPELRIALGPHVFEQQGAATIELANGAAGISRFVLAGPAGEIALAGTAGLLDGRPLDLKLDGTLDAALASAFADTVQARGKAAIHVAVDGPAAQPEIRGHMELAGGQFSTRQPRIGIDGLNARLDFAGNRMTVSRLEGALNGGTLSGGGSVEYAGGELRNSTLALKADRVYLDFPEGLKTISNVALNLKAAADEAVLGGRVTVLEGGITDDMNLDSGILAALNAPAEIDLDEERNPLLEKLRFLIFVRTANPIVLDNNLGKAEVTADLRVLGTPYEPGLSGRLVIEEGGELRLQERAYAIERGVITFTNERRIEPSLDILARTSANEYDITLRVTGEPGNTDTVLTSDPELPEPEILAVLLTGKTMEEMRGQEVAVARNQVLSYLTGRVGSSIGRGIAGATGLSMVRIEPNLIAAETDPSARLTVGQDITRKLGLIYSMDLINSSDQIYVAEYDITRRFSSRGVRQADGSFRFDFRHLLRFGGLSRRRPETPREQRRIGHVSLLGDTYFPQPQVLDKLGVKPGRDYDFFKIRRGLDNVSRLYAREGLLEAGLRLDRRPNNGTIDLDLHVEPGPKVEFAFEGFAVPGGLRDRVRDAWLSGAFDAQRADDATRAIRTWLVERGHLQPRIERAIAMRAPADKLVRFDIQPGPKFRNVALEFEGARGVEPDELRQAIRKWNLGTAVHTDPARVGKTLAQYYRQQGFLDAAVERPRYELDADTATGKVVFPVEEGPRYRVGEVTFEGNAAITAAQLAEAAPLPKGETYRPVLRDHALERIREIYWERGYNDVEVQAVLERGAATGAVNVVFRIAERARSVVAEIDVRGNRTTSGQMIRGQLEVRPGDPLDLRRIAASRRNLYNTGAYSSVEIVREPVETAQAGADKPVNLRVIVREVQPFEFRYGGFYDTERGPGVIADITNRNSLGSARSLGLRTRYDSQLQEMRLHFSQPLLRRFPLETIVSPYLRRERNPATQDTDPFNVDRVGFSLQQQALLRGNYLLNYGYRIERSRTYDTGPDPFFDVPLRIASLTSALTRETRDDMLDATRGSFMSHAFQFSPASLGSELRFIKYFGQYFRYVPLEAPRIDLFTNRVRRPRLVYAGGVRVGLSAGLGNQSVPLSERFFAGGATTIRGFEQNSIGPSLGRQPLGGEAMLVVNNELRFPVVSIFDGVGFVDLGNVYSRVADFSLRDIRKAAGMGLRVRTPWFLLRLDYGFNLDRAPGEPRGRLFFSIGQAF